MSTDANYDPDDEWQAQMLEKAINDARDEEIKDEDEGEEEDNEEDEEDDEKEDEDELVD